MVNKNLYTTNKSPQYTFVNWVYETIIINLFSQDSGLFNEYRTPIEGILFTFIDINTLKKKIEEIISKSFGDYLKLTKLDIITQNTEKIEITIHLTINPDPNNPLIDLYELQPNHNIAFKITYT